MEMLKSACYFIGVLSVLIIAHEWGHFIVAKLCKMRVDDFSLFFGPKLICLGKHNGTEYNIRSIPLGGFVKIAGMEPEDSPTGRPIYKLVDVDAGIINIEIPDKSQPTSNIDWSQYDKKIAGLGVGAFEGINFDNVSERIIQAVHNAVSDEMFITPEGRENLEALKLSTGISADEDKYIEIILNASTSAAITDGYNQKPLWQRAAVIFAGPFMSIFFGYVLICVMGFTTGLPSAEDEHLVVGTVTQSKPAMAAGVKPGDWIMAVNGKETPNGSDALIAIRGSVNPNDINKAVPVNLTLKRNGSRINLTVNPYIDKGQKVDAAGKLVKDKDGKPVLGAVSMIGIGVDNVWTRYSLAESIRQGSIIIEKDVVGTFQSIFSKHVKDNVGGIISIGSAISENSKQGTNHVLWVAAMLSVGLGIMNLFPIPVLDGGHLVLLAWEGIRRRKLTGKEVYNAQMVGLVIIGALFLFVMYNDVMRLIRKQ